MSLAHASGYDLSGLAPDGSPRTNKPGLKQQPQAAGRVGNRAFSELAGEGEVGGDQREVSDFSYFAGVLTTPNRKMVFDSKGLSGRTMVVGKWLWFGESG